MNSKLINPYNLLGINSNSSISELKKNYYNLSLLTHPDKGGSNDDFQIVHLAYNYIKEQLINRNEKETTYEELEEEFEDFIKKQEETKPPCFYEIYKETNDWLNEFNKKFEEQCYINSEDNDNSNMDNNPFNKGYGSLMDESNISEDYLETEELQPNNTFETQIIQYEEPEYLPNTIINFPLDKKEINDFTELSGPIKMSDYKKSFDNSTIEMNTKHKNYQFKDFPKENINYLPNNF